MIIAGDFNTTLDYDLDNWNYRTRGNEQARIKVNQLIEDYNFLDPLRELRGDAREYTYKSNSGPQRSRLDFFLVSESLRPLIKEANIYHRYLSDHKPIGLKINGDGFTKGKGLWRVKDQLYKNEGFNVHVRKEIKFLVSQ